MARGRGRVFRKGQSSGIHGRRGRGNLPGTRRPAGRHSLTDTVGSREGFVVEVTLQVSLEGCVGALQVEDRVEAFQTNSCRGECCLLHPSRQCTGDSSQPSWEGRGWGQTIKGFPLTEP